MEMFPVCRAGGSPVHLEGGRHRGPDGREGRAAPPGRANREGQRVHDFAVSSRQEGGLEGNHTRRHCGLRGSGPSEWPQRAVSPGAFRGTSFLPQRDLCPWRGVEPEIPDPREWGLSCTMGPLQDHQARLRDTD